MSIIRAPYRPNRFRGELDRLLVDYLLDEYFEEGQKLLDPMAGGRTVEHEAAKRGITCVSNDLYFEKGWNAARSEGWPHENGEFDGVFLHPPYFKVKKYGDSDIGKITDYWHYIHTIVYLLREAHRVVKSGGYVILIIGDRREEGRIRLIHSDIYYKATIDLGLSLDDYVLWELSATGTPMLGTKHMMMFNWVLVFKVKGVLDDG